MALFSEEYPFVHICPGYKEVLRLKHQVCEQIQYISSRISSVHRTALSVHLEKAVLFHTNTVIPSDQSITFLFV